MVERRAAVLKYIQARGEVSTAQLFSQFSGYAPKTIRRDLTHWEQAGAITRSYGKAWVNRQYIFQLEAMYPQREEENAAAKEAIAQAAIGLLGEHKSLYIDAGTSTMAFARKLPQRSFAVLTNAPNIALAIVQSNLHCSVLLTGGGLNPKTLGCSGYNSTEFIRLMNIDVAIMGASGFGITNGFVVGESFEATMKREAIAKAEKVIVLMDSSKIGVSMPFTFARETDVDILVCDEIIDSETENHLRAKGVRVLKAQTKGMGTP